METPTETKICKGCGKEFTLRREWQKYCTQRCKDSFNAAERRAAIKMYRAAKVES